MRNEQTQELITIQPTAEILTRQGLPYFFGISGRNGGSHGAFHAPRDDSARRRLLHLIGIGGSRRRSMCWKVR